MLITGGAGFVGSHTVAAVARAGHHVRLLVRSRERALAALAPLGVTDAEFVSGDVRDAAAVQVAVAGCDAAIHGAAVYSFAPMLDGAMADINVRGTEVVLDAALAAGLDPVVHVSSYVALAGRPAAHLRVDGPVGEPAGAYATSKAAAERVARARQAQGAPVVITYPGGVFGPHDPNHGENTVAALRVVGGRWALSPQGGFPLTDVRDLADLHAALLAPGRGPRRYAAPNYYVTVADLYAAVRRVTGRQVRAVGLPLRPLAGVLAWLNRQQGRLPLPLPAAIGPAYFLALGNHMDGEPAAHDLGVHPRPLDVTVADTIRWLVESEQLSPRYAGALLAAEPVAASS